MLRRFGANDSYEELTRLLHRAYAELAAMGFRFHATFQAPDVTRKRAERGECWVADLHGRVIGTVTFYPCDRTDGSPWYDRPDVASTGQLGVDPDYRRHGIGARLMDLVEDRARATGAREIALDTSEGAKHLIALYERRGYRFVEHAQWSVTNYRSVILSKSLAP